jgi:class 3 adenylate cyclase
MIEPRIQYLRTSDGVTIAYYVAGGGPPLVKLSSLPLAHLQLEWQAGEHEMAELIGAQRTYIRYDARGFGLSDRDIGDFSLDAMVRDLEALADHLSLERFQLMAAGLGAPIALAYAAKHPAQVSHLELGFYGSGREIPDEQLNGIMALGDQNWELATETLTHAVLGWAHGEMAHEVAEIMRHSTTPAGMRTFIRQARGWNAEELLPRITASTLIVVRRSGSQPDLAEGRRAAGFIPNARLLALEGDVERAQDDELAAIWAFFSDGQELLRAAPEAAPVTATILFTDIVDSTGLTEKLGDAHFREHAKELDEALRAVIRASGGAVVEGKVLGDGVMAVFTSARQAIDAALRCVAASADTELRLHLGIHAGDVIRDGTNVYGGAVNIAARVAADSAPGEILVTDVVRALARTSASVGFDDRGERVLRGIAEPQRLYAVHDRGA